MRSGLAMWPRPARFVPRSSGRPASERARVIARVAGIAAARGPVRATCLRRSLLIWWLLRREGIESALRIGVRHEAGTLQAHAWVEHEGVPFGEMNDPVARYASLDGDFGRALGESG